MSLGLRAASGDCQAGSFSAGSATSAACTPCPFGSFGIAAGLSACSPCASGFFAQVGSIQCQTLEHESIVLTLTGSVETFFEGSERRRAFLSGLALTLLAIPERQIIIISVRSGSVILELGFLRDLTSAVSPVQATLLLKEATSAGKLESFGATGLSIGGQSINVPTTSSSQVPLIVGISVGGFVVLVIIGVLVRHARIFIGKYKQNKNKAARVDEIAKKQSMNEFVKILDNEIEYDSSSKPIISGNFGVVRKAIWNGIPVAVETLKTNWSTDDRQNFDREARLMHSVNHPNCVRLYGVCSTANEESLVMEWMDGGDLSQLL